jgi:hypothetical protein
MEDYGQSNGQPGVGEQFDLSYHHVVQAHEADGMDPGHLDGLKSKIGAMAEVLRRFRAERQTLGDSGKYTMAGLMDAERELAATFAGEIKRLGDVSGLKDNIRQHEAKLKPQPTGDATERLIATLRQQEIRYAIQGMVGTDPLKVGEIYREALRDGNLEIMTAIEHWPLRCPVAAELMAEGQQARLEARDPVVAAQLRSLRTLQQTIERAVKDAISELPLAQADQLQQLAAGESESREGR